MRCETCQGMGWGVDNMREMPDGWLADRIPCRCRSCGGSGISHCCDGIQEQPAYGRSPAMDALDAMREFEALPPEVKARAHAAFVEGRLSLQEQRDPGDETREFHENPIIDALLTEASDAAIGAIIGDEITEWPDELGQMERNVTGCADDCCHPSHHHAAERQDGFREFKFSKDMRATLAIGEVRELISRNWSPTQIDWRETLEKAREFNALPDTHDEWRSLNDADRK